MTEPTQAQIDEARAFGMRFAEWAYSANDVIVAEDLARLIAHIRREARNAALEEAAKVCDAEGDSPSSLAAMEIRALKDQP